MLFQKTVLALFASASLVAAFPGGGDHGGGYSYTPPEKSTCSAEYKTKTKTGETVTAVVTTKTVYVPVTKVDSKPTTVVAPVPITSVGASSKTVTKYETALKTKTYPVTTVIYKTEVKTEVDTKTAVETVPFTNVVTSYKTSVGTNPVTYVTSKASESVCTETKKVPYTSTYVETKTVCKTKGGYGDH